MVENHTSHRSEFHKIEWQAVRRQLEMSPMLASLHGALLPIFVRCREAAAKKGVSYSTWAERTLTALLCEELIDLTLALKLDAATIGFLTRFDMPETVAGRAEKYPDGLHAIVFNGNMLIDQMVLLDHSQQGAQESGGEMNNEELKPLGIFVYAIAHEAGHLRQMQQLSGIDSTTQEWDIDAPFAEATEEQIAKYLKHPMEANATAVAVRYMREKKRVGNPLWEVLSESGYPEMALANIMRADYLLGLRTLEELLEICRISPIERFKNYRVMSSLVNKVQSIQEREGELKERLTELS